MRAVEMVCNKIIPLAFERSHKGEIKKLSTTIASNQTVFEHWEGLTSEQNMTSDHFSLKHSLIEVYVKVRCFAFAKKTMEHHKQQKGEPTQKSRSFRTKLNSAKQTEE